MTGRIVLVLVLVLLAGACATTQTEVTSLPTEPPWGLDTVDLPDDADAIAEVFAAMPAEVDGVPLETTAPEFVAYGADEHLLLGVLGVADIRDFSGITDMTVTDFLSGLVNSGELETAESELDDSKPLVWVASTNRGNGDLFHDAAWAAPDGEWLFTASADSPEARTELIHAFINAVQTKGS